MARSYQVTWTEDRSTGKGILVVNDDQGNRIGSVWHDDPINAATDSHAIAAAVESVIPEGGAPVSVDHDGEFVHLTY